MLEKVQATYGCITEVLCEMGNITTTVFFEQLQVSPSSSSLPVADTTPSLTTEPEGYIVEEIEDQFENALVASLPELALMENKKRKPKDYVTIATHFQSAIPMLVPLIQVLEPLEVFTQSLGATSHQTSSMVWPAYYVSLKTLTPKPNEKGTIIATLKECISKGIHTRFNKQFEMEFVGHKNQGTFYAIATYLDPSRKNFWNDHQYIPRNYRKGALKIMHEKIVLLMEDPSVSTTVTTTTELTLTDFDSLLVCY
jgi:hypothetical protein